MTPRKHTLTTHQHRTFIRATKPIGHGWNKTLFKVGFCWKQYRPLSNKAFQDSKIQWLLNREILSFIFFFWIKQITQMKSLIRRSHQNSSQINSTSFVAPVVGRLSLDLACLLHIFPFARVFISCQFCGVSSATAPAGLFIILFPGMFSWSCSEKRCCWAQRPSPGKSCLHRQA